VNPLVPPPELATGCFGGSISTDYNQSLSKTRILFIIRGYVKWTGNFEENPAKESRI
jgi:hypothetical protein